MGLVVRDDKMLKMATRARIEAISASCGRIGFVREGCWRTIVTTSNEPAADPNTIGPGTSQEHRTRPQSPTFSGLVYEEKPFWQKIGRWQDVPREDFLSHRWQVGQPE